jgi:hypothetical protein
MLVRSHWELLDWSLGQGMRLRELLKLLMQYMMQARQRMLRNKEAVVYLGGKRILKVRLLRNAKDQNGIPRSQQPDKTIKPNTPEGEKAGLTNKNVKQY